MFTNLAFSNGGTTLFTLWFFLGVGFDSPFLTRLEVSKPMVDLARFWLLTQHGPTVQTSAWNIPGILITTVDGRNHAPVDRWFIPLFIGFQPSKVVQDVSHQQ